MNIEIGSDRIIDTQDTITTFACQIGVTRIGAGGRCMPRTKRGGMTTVTNLVASTVDPDEASKLEARMVAYPVPTRKVLSPAPLAKMVVACALLVISLPPCLAEGLTVRAILGHVKALFTKNLTLNIAVAVALLTFTACHPVTRAMYATLLR